MILERNRYALLALDSTNPAAVAAGTVKASPPEAKVALITVRGAMSESPVQGLFENILEGSDVGTWAELRALSLAADAAVGPDGFVGFDVLSGGGTVAGSDTTAATIEGLQATTFLWNAGAANSAMMPIVAAVDHVAGSPMAEFGSMSARFDMVKDRKPEGGGEFDSVAADGDVLKIMDLSDPKVRKSLEQRAKATKESMAVAIARGRDIPREALDKIMDGRIFNTAEAISHGLVDAEFPTREAFIASLLSQPDKEADMAEDSKTPEVTASPPVASAETPKPPEVVAPVAASADSGALTELLTLVKAQSETIGTLAARVDTMEAASVTSLELDDKRRLAQTQLTPEAQAHSLATITMARAAGKDDHVKAEFAMAEEAPKALDADLLKAHAAHADGEFRGVKSAGTDYRGVHDAEVDAKAQAHAAENPDDKHAGFEKALELTDGRDDIEVGGQAS